MENGITDMKNEDTSDTPVGQASHIKVGQASRLSSESSASHLSEHFWRRHLPHFQLSAGYYFITFSTYNRQLLSPLQKDIVFNAIRFLDGKKYELYAVAVLNDHSRQIWQKDMRITNGYI